MIDSIMNFKFNSQIGILLYWVPLSFCIFGYTIRTASNYMKDRTDRAKSLIPGNSSYYNPTDTLGTLIGRAFVTICPVANIWALLFDIAPVVFSKAFKWVGKVFNQPLVPKPRKD